MRFSGVSALAIWSNATRTLTGLGAGTIVAVTSIHTALANAATADLRPAAGAFREIRVIGEALANVTWVEQFFDGVTARSGTFGTSGVAFDYTTQGVNAFGPALFNNGTVGGNYNIAGWDLKQ